MFNSSRQPLNGYFFGAIFFTIQELDCIEALSFDFFVRYFHTFFNDFDLSKRDKQVRPSGYWFLLRPEAGFNSFQVHRVLKPLGIPG